MAEHPAGIASVTADEFGITRQAVGRHLSALVDEGLLTAKGRTKGRKYTLTKLVDESFQVKLSADMEEDTVWTERVKPLISDLRQNIYRICYHGFTEMMNNVIDHSEAGNVRVDVERTAAEVKLLVQDDGVGIFNKVARELGLSDKRQALLELTKGKFTTDPAKHTGEGIFFTSRMFDRFWIVSDDLSLLHDEKRGDWLLEDKEKTMRGTCVIMEIDSESDREASKIFDQFTTPAEATFSKTHVPLKLAEYGNENLISRSQAKRILSRFDRFEEVVLDFSGVELIGQAFADEIFRVFVHDHPNVRLVHVNANSAVKRMIMRAKAQGRGARNVDGQIQEIGRHPTDSV